MRGFLWFVLFSVAAVILIFVAALSWPAYQSWNAVWAVESAFSGLPNVEILELYDENEEFPLCCPEVFISLRVGHDTIDLWNLDESSFSSTAHEPIVLYRVNGGLLQCGTPSMASLGVDIRAYPGTAFESLGIRRPTDVVDHHEAVVAFFSAWPTEPEAGVSIESRYGVETCWVMPASEFRAQALDQVLP